MTVEESSRSLLERVLSSESNELRRLVAEGLLPVPPVELLPSQVALAEGDDEDLAQRARTTLIQLDALIAAKALEEIDDASVLRWFGRRRSEPRILEVILRKRHSPPALLVEMASTLDPDQQEILVLRQDAILDEPGILDALDENPNLSAYVARRIREYRQHLVRPRGPDEETAPRDAEAPRDDDVEDEVSPHEVQQALEEARRREKQGEVDRITGLSEAQLRTLPVPVRLKLGRNAPRSLRTLLIRDPSSRVALSTLRNNSFADSELEQIAASRSIVPEVLEAIAKDRQMSRRYSVVATLARNPKTPVGIAIRLCSRLSVRDLRSVSRDHNAQDAVRSTCRRLYTIKHQ